MEKVKQIVLFPFMAQSHISSSISLAKRIQKQSNCCITLVNTHRNIEDVKSSMQTSSGSNDIQFFELPLDASEYGLPPGTYTVDGMPIHLWISFFHATESLRQAMECFLADLCAIHGPGSVCIIVDYLLGWAVEVGKKLGVFSSTFYMNNAYAAAIESSLWMNLPHQKTDSDEFPVPDFPTVGLIRKSQLSIPLRTVKEGDSWTSFFQRQMGACLKADGYLFNTVQEVDQNGIKYFRRKTGRPVWGIGPLALFDDKLQSNSSMAIDPCIQWLNLHPPSSVLYVAFGSINAIPASQMMELAAGLEASGQPFIWAIWPPVGFDLNEEFRAEWLPEGFETRMAKSKQGMLVRKWAPQLEILAHKSTRAFLSHCRWASTMESLMHGVPMIGWPLFAEQYATFKMLEEDLGVCVGLTLRDSSEVDRGHVKKVIDMVMGGTEKGVEMRVNAQRVKEMMEAAIIEDGEFKGSSVRALADVIHTAFST